MALAAAVSSTRPPLYYELGRYLFQGRRQAHLKQRELEERLSLTQGFIAQVEQGRRRPSPAELHKWAVALGLSPTQAAVLAGYIRESAAPPEELPDDELDSLFKVLPRRLKRRVLAAAEIFMEYETKENTGDAGPQDDDGIQPE